MVSTIGGEASRLDGILLLVVQHRSQVIALLLEDGGIPAGVDSRLAIGRRILECTRRAGVPDDQVCVDPLALAIGTRTEGDQSAREPTRALRREYPDVRFSIGLSNISFGLPARTLVNQVFLAQLLAARQDAAIVDPMEQGLINMLYATELILGRGRFCRSYTTAFRAGRIVA
jgi:5-methyltetrahydrofolate--homocysteine methyltransferase